MIFSYHNVQISFCSVKDPVRYDLPIVNWATISACSALFKPGFLNELFFAAFKPSNSAKVPWSKLFALVFFDSLKCLQLRLISLSSCHSLPFCDTFYRKYELSFSKSRKNSLEQGFSNEFKCLDFIIAC